MTVTATPLSWLWAPGPSVLSPQGNSSSPPCSSRRRELGLPQRKQSIMVTISFWYFLIKHLFGLLHVLEEKDIGKVPAFIDFEVLQPKIADQFFEST